MVDRRPDWAVVLGVGVTAGLVGAFAAGMNSKPAWAQTTPPVNSDVIALTQNGPSGVQWIYLVDVRQRVLSVYEFEPKRPKLKLSAVRQFATDQELEEYNNDPPTVGEIRRFVQNGRAGKD